MPTPRRGSPTTGTPRRSSTSSRPVGRCSTRRGSSPTRTPAPCYRDELAALRAGRGEPGDDARVAARGPRGAPPRPRQDARTSPRHARARRRAAHPVHDRLLLGIGETRADRLVALDAIAASHERHGHVQEVIVQNFLPKPAPRWPTGRRAPLEELRWTIAAARLVLPDAIHVQAPPNLVDDPLTIVEAGADDLGGISPVTARPREPRAGLAAARHPLRVLEPRRLRAHAPAHRLPRVRARRRSAGSTRPAYHGPAAPRRRGLGRERRLGLRRHRAAATARRAGTDGGSPVRVAEVLAGVALGHELGDDELVTLFAARGRRRRRGLRRGRRAAREARRRRRHLRRQPQHQLHERLHVQVPLLRVLQGPALAQPSR